MSKGLSLESKLCKLSDASTDIQARSKIESLEQQIHLLSISVSEGKGSASSNRHSPTPSPPDSRISMEQRCTAVIVGFAKHTHEAASAEWIQNQISCLCHVRPTKVYSKGQNFQGTPWIKFANQEIRDRGVSIASNANMVFGDNPIRIVDDLPLSMRVEKNFLCGLRRLLLQWGWEAFEVKVDLQSRWF